MAYDGSAWNEATPDNNTVANELDDVAVDIKKGVRSRMIAEHLWPASQSATNEAGLHRYVTLSSQTGAPALVVGTNTQVGAIYSTTGSLVYMNSASSKITIVAAGKTGLNIAGGIYSSTGTQGDLIIGTTGGALKVLAASADGYLLVTKSNTADPVWLARKALQADVAVSLSSTAQATSDGFLIVSAYGVNDGGDQVQYTAKSDNNASPSTIRGYVFAGFYDGQDNGGQMCVPIRKNDYYSVTRSVISGDGGGITSQMAFIPFV
jgi:hypothetical protein